MMTLARLLPQHRSDWCEAFDADGVIYEARAHHYTRRRVPRPQEAARAMMRGRPPGMVEETDYEWIVTQRNPPRQVCTVKQVLAGFIFMGSPGVHRTLIGAAKAGINRMAVR